jgi:hypothetical protein
MNFEQVFQKVSVACFNRGRRSEDHFIEITEMIASSRQLGPRRRNVKCVGVTPVSPVRCGVQFTDSSRLMGRS